MRVCVCVIYLRGNTVFFCAQLNSEDEDRRRRAVRCKPERYDCTFEAQTATQCRGKRATALRELDERQRRPRVGNSVGF